MVNGVKGYRSYTIVDRLEGDLLVILRDQLSVPQFDLDGLTLQILLTLSKRHYVSQLLFRDFHATSEALWCTYDVRHTEGSRVTERIHVQAFTYAEELLSRRLTLAQRLGDKPGNMHGLLAGLCRYGPDTRWRQLTIERDSHQRPCGESTPFFLPVARELADKRDKLGEGFGEIARDRHRHYGPLWLKASGCAAEVPEELSLTDVLEITPKPVVTAFAEDPDIQRTLARVLDALNERYMLLRACGLNPDPWLVHLELSINNLKELKQLRRRARDLLAEVQVDDDTAAYCRAFGELQGEQKKFAGYRDFDDFRYSEAGRAILNYPLISLDDSGINMEGDGELSWHETLATDAPAVEDVLSFEQQMRALMRDQPERFGDRVTCYCFEALLGQQRPWYGEAGVLRDPDFQRLLKSEPCYADLAEAELVDRLSQRLDELIKRAFSQYTNDDE